MSFNKSRIKDTDYLAISSRVRVLEKRLLTRERMERMIEAKDNTEAAKVLSECGYGELADVTAANLEALLAKAQAETFADIGSAVQNSAIIDVFRIRYDYHNAKVLVKAEAVGAAAERLLLAAGRYDPAALMEDYHKDDLRAYSETFQAAVAEARDLLAANEDPQLCDFVLDRACYAELTEAAARSGSPFVRGYVRLLIDSANLRAAVRAARLGQGNDFLKKVLLPDGEVSADAVLRAKTDELGRVYGNSPLAQAAELGAAVSAPGAGPLTAFERACDDAVTAYVSGARRIPFGEQPVVGYLYAREAELTAIRTILSGRMAGLSGDVIRQRLREPYE